MASNSDSSTQKEQQHPQYMADRHIVNTLLAEDPTDYNLAELARLMMRYQGFPGARDIQADLTKVMNRWKFTEDTLFEKTREIHQTPDVYRNVGGRGGEDWS
ncbi:MAG: DUF3288 family protein [Cyanobacteria bacterium P01_E01_bin.6]